MGTLLEPWNLLKVKDYFLMGLYLRSRHLFSFVQEFFWVPMENVVNATSFWQVLFFNCVDKLLMGFRNNFNILWICSFLNVILPLIKVPPSKFSPLFKVLLFPLNDSFLPFSISSYTVVYIIPYMPMIFLHHSIVMRSGKSLINLFGLS
jgi:hypothetical protein